MVEDIVGCKWSLSVIEAVKSDIVRPGEIQRAIDGISTKVLNERFNKMQRYGILKKTIFPEVPPRVEYRLTEFGNKFIIILDQIKSLQNEM
ncbi:MAG: winged helix-turn-helix transcriptional regulator [Gammaproteobacteria bacterium]